MNTQEQSTIDVIWVILFKVIGAAVVPLMLLLGDVFRILSNIYDEAFCENR